MRRKRQNCSLRDHYLFTVIVVDLEAEMRKVNWGEVKIGEEKIYSIREWYSLLLSEEEGEMNIIGKLVLYLEKRFGGY